jgi:sugar phosphate isomerase/epimerase
MRLACASRAFDRAFARGDLTQLEFVDACARELACDGVVLDVAHFPRVDEDYLAQLKKMTTDLGLTIAAYADDTFFLANADGMAKAVERALLLGAPLVAAPLGREAQLPWSAQLTRINGAATLAKTANVTIAVRNAPGTYAATGYDCKRLCKEGDSAWVRLGVEPATLDAATDPATLVDWTVLLWCDASKAASADRTDAFRAFRGFLALDRADGTATFEEMRTAIAQRRRLYTA